MDETSLMSASGPENNESGVQTRLAKFLCSFGGSVLPRPLDGQLRYVGGETRIITVPYNISFSNLLQRMREIFEGADIIKYQQPYEDLDALVSVVNDDDVINMMDEYDKLTSESDTPTRLRIFLFSQNVLEGEALNSPPTIYDAFSERESEQRYLDALNCVIDSKSGLNTPDIEGYENDNISLRHLNVPRQSPYGPNFSDVESPYNETSHFSPRLHNPQTYELFRDVPFGAEDFNEKSGYPGNFSRGDHLNDANGAYCEHCMYPLYHQKSGCLTPDSRYLDPPHRHYKGYEHNGFNHQCNDYSRNNLENNDYYNYYHHDANGNDRMRVPHSQVKYCYEDPRINRAPEPYTPDGSRVSYLYPHGNLHDLHDNARLYNLPLATDVGTNNIPNTTQQGETTSQQYNKSAIYNLDSLYQVPQNVPPIPSLMHKTQVHMLSSASPTPYESPNAVSVNPAFVRVNQDGTPNGVRSPNGGINPVFVRSTLNGISNDIGMNPTVKALSNGTPNGCINSIFVKSNPDLSSNSRIKPTFMIGTPEDSPRLSGASPVERVGNHLVGSSENSPNIPVPEICTGMPDYGQLPGSRLNPNFAIQENGPPCQMIIPVMGPPTTGTVFAETVVAGTPIIETPVLATSVKETPATEVLVAQNPPIIVSHETSQKVNAPSFEIPPMKAEDKSLFELHNMAAHMEEKAYVENHVVHNQDALMVGGCPLKHLAESIKSMALEGVEVIGTKQMINDEKINLNEVTSENDNMDFEQSSKSDGVSRIESTTAEQEALSKGLQTIKNEDLEEIRELGHGTYGSVYHGKWRGSDVAIKRIKASCFTGNPSERDKLIADFWKEAQILSSLHHPNVVSFYGVVRDGPDGGLATVTEFMVNGSLKQFLHKKDRTIDRRKRIILAMDAAFGMEYLHSKNIVHFDLKCENLLVNMKDAQRPICKIGDLGLSKVKRHTMVSGGVRGTLPWMAPELLNGKNDMVSEKVDVYSFGICLWELLTGEEPYAEMKTHSIIGGILHDSLRPQIPSWCDPEWKALMMSCWSTDPNERPSFSEISQKLRKMAPK